MRIRHPLEVPALIAAAIAAAGLAGCFGRTAIHPKWVEAVAGEQAAPGAPAEACAAEERPPTVDARWRPAVAGALRLEELRGDPRLTVVGPAPSAWSADSSMFAIAEDLALVVWRVGDGELVSIDRYIGRDPFDPADVAWSPDGRWIAISGVRKRAGKDVGVTLVLDRHGAAMREVEPGLGPPEFSADSATLRGYQQEVELASMKRRAIVPGTPGRGVVVRVKGMNQSSEVELVDPGSGAVVRAIPVPSPLVAMRVLDGGAVLAIAAKGALELRELPGGNLVRTVPLPGAEMAEIAPDGRRVAGWTLARVSLEEVSAPKPPEPAPFLAVWDVATGRQLWRDPKRCCRRWVFTADGALMQHAPGSLHDELLRADTGEATKLSGYLGRISPDGKHVAVGELGGYAFWSTDGKTRLSGPARTGGVVARSPTGARVTETPAGTLLIAPAPTPAPTSAPAPAPSCTRLLPAPGDGDSFTFTSDGATVHGIHAAGAGTGDTRISTWSAADGRPRTSLRVPGRHQIAVIAGLARAAVVVEGGVQLFDLTIGRELRRVEAPRVDYSAPVRGQVWDIRDLDGDRPGQIGGSLTTTDDGRYLAGATHLGTSVATIWDLVEPRRVVDLPVRGIISTTAIERGGRFVAAGTREGRLYLWARPTHAPVHLAAEHEGRVRRLAFSPDGTRLATGADDGTVLVIDTATGAVAGAVQLTADRPALLSWSRDGSLLTIDTERRLVALVRL